MLCGRKFWHESVFMVPWSFWKAARDCWERHKKTKQKEIAIVQQYGWTWETPGTASAKAEDLLPDWEVDTGGFMASSTCK